MHSITGGDGSGTWIAVQYASMTDAGYLLFGPEEQLRF
jgi:hypothetical protein